MKNYAILAALLLAEASAYENEFGNAKEYVKIVEGFLMGSIQAEGLTNIEQCIQDGEDIFRDAESAYEHFKKKDVTDAIDGVKDIANAIQKISDAMKDCKSSKGDWDKMAKIAKEFKHPTSFAWHIAGDIWHNRVEITNEVETAVTDWEQKKYYDFGLQCGQAASHVFIGEETQKNMKKEMAAMVLQGFTNTYGGKFNLLNLLLCIYQEDQALLFLDVAYQAFEKALHDTDWQDTLGDLMGTGIGLVGAYQQFEQGLPVCEDIVSYNFNWGQISSDMTFVGNGVENVEQMTLNIASHEDEIKAEFKQLKEQIAYTNGDFVKVGEFFGNLIQKAAHGKKTMLGMNGHGQKQDLFLY